MTRGVGDACRVLMRAGGALPLFHLDVGRILPSSLCSCAGATMRGLWLWLCVREERGERREDGPSVRLLHHPCQAHGEWRKEAMRQLSSQAPPPIFRLHQHPHSHLTRTRRCRSRAHSSKLNFQRDLMTASPFASLSFNSRTQRSKRARRLPRSNLHAEDC